MSGSFFTQKGGRKMKEQNYIPLVRLEMVQDRKIPYNADKLDCPEKVAELAMKIIGTADREYVLVISVNSKCLPVALEITSIGSVNAAFMEPREIFKHAIISNAVGILLVHNHPSGDCEPSKEDKDVTQRIRKAGELLGIQVYDHVIIGNEKYYSFRERNQSVAQ